MEHVLTLRPFVPAKDFAVSKRFYQAMGFTLTGEADKVAFLKLGEFSFILQDFYVQAFAENFMMQVLVRDADAWWRQLDSARLVAEFGIPGPRAPAKQSWGLKVGFIVDPSGVLWHIAEALF
jgi:catechol 2,3-dioxygenase-like lactoylglutathione lyase family enzyme